MTSYNTIESEEIFMPIFQEPQEYEFFQTKEIKKADIFAWGPETIYK